MGGKLCTYVAFKTGEHWFAIPVQDIQRIIPITPQTPFAVPPHMPEYALCVAEFLNGPVMVVDPLRLLHMGRALQGFSLVVLLKYAGRKVGFAANKAAVVTIEEEALSKSPCVEGQSFLLDSEHCLVLDVRDVLGV